MSETINTLDAAIAAPPAGAPPQLDEQDYLW